jgi:hypothetical protein
MAQMIAFNNLGVSNCSSYWTESSQNCCISTETFFAPKTEEEFTLPTGERPYNRKKNTPTNSYLYLRIFEGSVDLGTAEEDFFVKGLGGRVVVENLDAVS